MNESPYKVTGTPSGRLAFNKGSEPMRFTPEFEKATKTFVTPTMLSLRTIDEIEESIRQCLAKKSPKSQ
jgi:hypothetical protein